MEKIFRTVLIMSCVGTVLYIVLLFLKPLTRRLFSDKWHYYIWILALLLLSIPFQFDVQPKRNVFFSGNSSVQKNINNEEFKSENIEEKNTYSENIYNAEDNTGIKNWNYFYISSYIWAAGVVLFLTGAVISYIRFIHIVKTNSIPSESDILEFEKQSMNIRRRIYIRRTAVLNAPLMTGIIKPVLLLPDKDMSSEDLYYIFLHELTHLKRLDLIYKWFAMAVNSLHWFNPFVYLIVREINEACEISCDISVTRDFSDEEKKAYMNTILKLAGNSSKKIE